MDEEWVCENLAKQAAAINKAAFAFFTEGTCNGRECFDTSMDDMATNSKQMKGQIHESKEISTL